MQLVILILLASTWLPCQSMIFCAMLPNHSSSWTVSRARNSMLVLLVPQLLASLKDVYRQTVPLLVGDIINLNPRLVFTRIFPVQKPSKRVLLSCGSILKPNRAAISLPSHVIDKFTESSCYIIISSILINMITFIEIIFKTCV